MSVPLSSSSAHLPRVHTWPRRYVRNMHMLRSESKKVGEFQRLVSDRFSRSFCSGRLFSRFQEAKKCPPCKSLKPALSRAVSSHSLVGRMCWSSMSILVGTRFRCKQLCRSSHTIRGGALCTEPPRAMSHTSDCLGASPLVDLEASVLNDSEGNNNINQLEGLLGPAFGVRVGHYLGCVSHRRGRMPNDSRV